MLDRIVKNSGFVSWKTMVKKAKKNKVIFNIPRYYLYNKSELSFNIFSKEVIPLIIKEKLKLEYDENDAGIYLTKK